MNRKRSINLNLKVADLIVNGQWFKLRLVMLFPEEDVKRILDIMTSSEMEDSWL